MHDDRKAAGESDAGLLQAAVLGDIRRPGLQGKGLPAASEDRVRRFIAQLAYHAVSLLGDATRPVDLTGLVAPLHT